MKGRNKKALSLLLAAIMCVSPAMSGWTLCAEEPADETAVETVAAEVLSGVSDEDVLADTASEDAASEAFPEDTDMGGEMFDAYAAEDAGLIDDADLVDGAELIDDADLIGQADLMIEIEPEEEEFILDETSDEVLFEEEIPEEAITEEVFIWEETFEEEEPLADNAEIDRVKALIDALPQNPDDISENDREQIEAAAAAFDALSAEDQAVLDTESSPVNSSSQPYGRLLETAQWALWSLEEADNTTTLADGTYDATTTPALASSYSKGKSTSSRQKPWSVKEIRVENGKAYGTVMVESSSYTSIKYQGTIYNKTNTSGYSEFANVPIDLNSTFYILGNSSSMPLPIAFSITTEIEEPERTGLEITNNTGMFKAVTAFLETVNGQTDLVMALSGTGYREMFKGTYEQAVANGTNTDNWIHGYTNADGKWEFRIPLSDDESYVPVVAVSNTYYNSFLNGQNSLERAFYPRQFTVDREAKTLVTGDYEFSQDLAVTNNVKMFKVSSAKLETVGGPNSNNYKADLVMTMGSTSFDKAYVGTAEEAAAAAETIAIGADQTFRLPVKWVETFGQPETLKTWIGEPTVVAFHSVKNNAWYQRKLTVSETEGTLVIDPSPIVTPLEITNNTGMFKAVTAFLETVDGKTNLVMALSGTGYREMFKGTYEQAVANGTNTDNWIHGYTNADGKWEFRIPLSDDESYVPVVVISNTYYNSFLNGQNSLERAFYPRQLTVDREAKTLVTGDYEFSQDLAVTNNVKMFKVSSAKLETVGGPNSNNYKADLVMTMGSTSFDKAYVGTAEEAAAAAETIAIGAGQTFSLPVKWVETVGQPETLKTWIGEPTVVAFHSVNKDTWYERELTIDEEASTLTIWDDTSKLGVVETMISELPDKIGLADQDAVDAAKAAFDALGDELQGQLNQELKEKLDAAIEAVQEAQKQADEAAKLVKAVAEKEKIGLADKELVDNALAAMAKLDDAQKAVVEAAVKNAAQVLANAKAAIDAAQKQAEAVAKQISALANVGADDEGRVNDARKALAGLDDAQKALVNKLLGASAEAKIAEAAKKVSDAKAAAKPVLPAAGTVLTDGSSNYVVETPGSTVAYQGPVSKKVKKVVVPNTVTIDGVTYTVDSIAPNACRNCKKLTNVTISAGITSIGANAFSGTKSLKNVTIKSKQIKKIGKKAFYKSGSKNYKKLKVKVPKSKLKAYRKLLKNAKLSSKAKVTK